MIFDLFTPIPVAVAHAHSELFTPEFLAYLPGNIHVWEAFEGEALKIAARRDRYSARTIVEVLRHHSATAEAGGAWKLDNDKTPCLARLFGLMNPGHAHLFEFREAKALRRCSFEAVPA